MASLVGQQLKDTYDSLLKTSDNDALGVTYKEITDGAGNGSNLYLGTGGNVGIGTTPFGWSSYGVLNVKGSGAIYGTGAGSTLSGVSHGAYYDGSNWKYAYTGVGATLMESVGSSSPYLAFYTANSGTADANISFSERLRIESGGDISFRDTSDNEAFYWDASAGSLGIGTTSPATSLHIKKTSGNAGFVLQCEDGQNAVINFGKTSDDSRGVINYDTSNDSMSFEVNNLQEAMRIDSSGNVGIGETNPSVALDVSGEVRASSGILFGTDTASANALDDYEEGTFTPVVAGTWTANPTSLTGKYTKIGNVVHVQVTFVGGAKASATIGYLEDLPFAASHGTGTVVDSGVIEQGSALFANTDRIWFTDNSFSGATTRVTGTYIIN